MKKTNTITTLRISTAGRTVISASTTVGYSCRLFRCNQTYDPEKEEETMYQVDALELISKVDIFAHLSTVVHCL